MGTKTTKASSRSRRKTADTAPAVQQAEEKVVLPPEAFTGANGEAPPEAPPIPPQQQLEGALQTVISQFMPTLGAVYIAKMFGIMQVDVLAFYAERQAQDAAARALQSALPKPGFRRQPSSAKKAATQRKKK